MTLKDLLRFNDLLLRFQKVERVVWVPGEERRENDVEHSYQLGMLAWFIIERDKLSLDAERALKYGLVHDLVEVHAGDTFFYADEKTREEKKEREQRAAERLKRDFPDFPKLHQLIDEYERQESAEARFVHALDKVVPMLNIYADGGRTWRTDDITLSMLIEKKRDILAGVPELKPYFDELVATLERQPELFSKHPLSS